MAHVDKLYDWLAGAPSPAADRALADALDAAEPPWFGRIVETLLSRHGPAAWTALVSRYGKLDQQQRQRVSADQELFIAGIEGALKIESSEIRLTALEAYRTCPTARMADLLAVAIRDPALPVREAAAAVLWQAADAVLAERGDHTDRAAHEQSVREIAAALRDVIRTVDVHLRVETVEPCLWFCEQLGEPFWETVDKPRSRVVHVIAENLTKWDSPRLAAFLLRASVRPDLRRDAHRILSEWHTPEQVAALLRHSALLADAGVRRGVLGIKSPQWFNELSSDLSNLPERLRAAAPAWVRAASYPDDERVGYLAGWAKLPNPKLHEAAVRGLASIHHDEALRVLLRVAAGKTPMADFARTHIAAAEAERASLAAQKAGARRHAQPHTSTTPFPGTGTPNSEFAMLWQLCRRTPPGENQPLVEIMVEHVGVWGRRLSACMRGSDARDRILALQMVRAGDLSGRFVDELTALKEDRIEGIRKLAAAMLDAFALKTQEQPTAEASPAARALAEAPRRTDIEIPPAVAEELRDLLNRLSARDDMRGNDAEILIQRLRTRMRQTFGRAKAGPTPVGAGSREHGP